MQDGGRSRSELRQLNSGKIYTAKWSVQIAGMIFKQILVHRKLSFCYIDAADENQTSQYGSYLIFDVLAYLPLHMTSFVFFADDQSTC